MRHGAVMQQPATSSMPATTSAFYAEAEKHAASASDQPPLVHAANSGPPSTPRTVSAASDPDASTPCSSTSTPSSTHATPVEAKKVQLPSVSSSAPEQPAMAAAAAASSRDAATPAAVAAAPAAPPLPIPIPSAPLSSASANATSLSALPLPLPIPIPYTVSASAAPFLPASYLSSPTAPSTASSSTTTTKPATTTAASSASSLHEEASAIAANPSGTFCSSSRDHNSVTIKANTNVKDAAGAVVKVLGRLPSVFVTALRLEEAHDSLNRAVKSIAVARKYVTDREAGSELSFLPFNRSNLQDAIDPSLFAFVCFKTQLPKGTTLLESDQTDLNVSRSSNANTMANAIIRIIKERGQVVMKAGGSEAIFVAMSAMVNARRRLKRNHSMDAMIVPAWITEDTLSTLGRESKFLRFNILPCPLNGPLMGDAPAAALAFA